MITKKEAAEELRAMRPNLIGMSIVGGTAYEMAIDALESLSDREEAAMIVQKPCPFCGKTVAIICTAKRLEECGNFEDESCPCSEYDDPGECGMKMVACDVNRGGCGASSGYFKDAAAAWAAWNRRPG